MKWLFLVHELQGLKSSDRVRIWRNTKKTGAILYKDSAYVLPYSKENLEIFQWILSEIKAVKGQASIFISQTIDNSEDKNLEKTFIQNSESEYMKIREKSDILHSRFNQLSKSSRLNERALKGL